MSAWVGPAIIAAAISGTIGMLSLYLNAWLTIRLERTRRREKVRDVQIALLSEIRAVFLYVRQKAVIDTFVKDMRETQFSSRAKDIQLLMYKDYTDMKKVEEKLARNARVTLEASIESAARRQ